MTDSHYKEWNVSSSSVLARLCLPLPCFASFFKKPEAKKTKMRGPFLHSKSEHRGQGFVLRSYVCSRGPSPCSRLCICTCTSPACCSRWQSCCSGSDLKSTHPHLKDKGNISIQPFSCRCKWKRLQTQRD